MLVGAVMVVLVLVVVVVVVVVVFVFGSFPFSPRDCSLSRGLTNGTFV